MLSTIAFSAGYVAPMASAPTRASSLKMEAKGIAPNFEPDLPWTSSEIADKAGLEDLAKKLNPTIGFWGVHSDALPHNALAARTSPTHMPYNDARAALTSPSHMSVPQG